MPEHGGLPGTTRHEALSIQSHQPCSCDNVRVSVADDASAELVQSVGLDQTTLAYPQAHIEHGPPLVITTTPERWSYAARLPLGVDPATGAGLAVEARLRVLEGKVGVGVLAVDEQSFVVEKEVAANHGLQSCIVLRLPCPPVVGPLIVRNVSAAGRSKAVLEDVTICRLSVTESPESTSGVSEPAREELPRLVRSLEYLRPLVPYPGWRFDSDWNNPDFSFQTRRRLWQYCVSKRWDAVVDLPWYGGVRLELPLLSDAGRQLFVGGCTDPNELVFLDAILKPGMVFVDVGAHLGLYTVFAALRTAAVWAFEPSSREFACLQRNLHRNKLESVQALKLALGNADQAAELHIADPMHSGQNTLHSFSHEGVVAARSETVEVRCLDRIVQERNLSRIDVLKVDTEQSELEIFEGAAQVLRGLRPWLLLEVNHAAGAPPKARDLKLIEMLHGFGYVFYAFDRSTGLLVEASGGHESRNLVAGPSRTPPPDDVMTGRRYYFENGVGTGR